MKQNPVKRTHFASPFISGFTAVILFDSYLSNDHILDRLVIKRNRDQSNYAFLSHCKTLDENIRGERAQCYLSRSFLFLSQPPLGTSYEMDYYSNKRSPRSWLQMIFWGVNQFSLTKPATNSVIAWSTKLVILLKCTLSKVDNLILCLYNFYIYGIYMCRSRYPAPGTRIPFNRKNKKTNKKTS